MVEQLVEVRTSVPGILFAYILRENPESGVIEFVADSHSMNPYANLDADATNDVDANEDGVIEPDGPDKLQWPGQNYPNPPQAVFASFDQPTTSAVYEDEFGAVISGYATISLDGRITAIIAVDVRAQDLYDLNSKSFTPLVAFLVFFFMLLLARFAALSRSIFRECCVSIAKRDMWKIVAYILCFATLGWLIWRYHALDRYVQRGGERLMAIAATAASQIDDRDLESLQFARDMRRPEYQRSYEFLNEIRNRNRGIAHVYILRPTWNEGIWEFVADADSKFLFTSFS